MHSLHEEFKTGVLTQKGWHLGRRTSRIHHLTFVSLLREVLTSGGLQQEPLEELNVF